MGLGSVVYHIRQVPSTSQSSPLSEPSSSHTPTNRRTMPPRSFSTASAISVLDWTDNDAYVSTFNEKAVVLRIAPPRKSVRFSEAPNTIFLIPHLNEFTKEETKATWFEPNEYACMKSEYKDTLFLMECGKTLDDTEHTARGLEYRTQEGAWARYENKRDAYNAVLDEQDIQWKEDYDDDEALRRVYLEHSTKCSESAHKLAMQDALEAETFCIDCGSPAFLSTTENPKIKGKRSLRRLFSKGKIN